MFLVCSREDFKMTTQDPPPAKMPKTTDATREEVIAQAHAEMDADLPPVWGEE